MTLTLVEQVEKHFEATTREKPKTLAEAVSNELMEFMPRISPELFDMKRNAEIDLPEKQRNKIIKDYKLEVFGYSAQVYNQRKFLGDIKGATEIPFFFYAIVPDKNVVTLPECLNVYALADFQVECWDEGEITMRDDRLCRKFPSHGTTTLEIKSKWKAPFKLDVSAKVPEVPESFREVGDEAISLCYQQITGASKELRRTTTYLPPRIGVLWAPTDKSLYVSEEIPSPPPRDPVLVLDIPDKERSYRHVVAAWNIGEELPFKNWISEYTECGVKDVN